MPKIGSNSNTGEFIVGIKAAKYINLVEGLVIPQEMQQTFDQFERDGIHSSKRLVILKKKYGSSNG